VSELSNTLIGQETLMSNINWGRVVLGGLLAGILNGVGSHLRVLAKGPLLERPQRSKLSGRSELQSHDRDVGGGRGELD
jgi:hypothetical protein